MIRFTKEALNIMNRDQQVALVRLAKSASTRSIDVSIDFSLPGGYISFLQTYNDESTIYGGIDPTGTIST